MRAQCKAPHPPAAAAEGAAKQNVTVLPSIHHHPSTHIKPSSHARSSNPSLWSSHSHSAAMTPFSHRSFWPRSSK
jgi:hypothetical protein